MQCNACTVVQTRDVEVSGDPVLVDDSCWEVFPKLMRGFTQSEEILLAQPNCVVHPTWFDPIRGDVARANLL